MIPKKIAKIRKFLTFLNTSLKSNLSLFTIRRLIKSEKVSIKATKNEKFIPPLKNNKLAKYNPENMPGRGYSLHISTEKTANASGGQKGEIPVNNKEGIQESNRYPKKIRIFIKVNLLIFDIFLKFRKNNANSILS